MPETDFQLGGGYTYQWQTAVFLALDYFADTLVHDEALNALVTGFLGHVDAVHLEGTTRGGSVELEDIALAGRQRRILIQVKTKQDRAGQWKPSDPLLKKALLRFYASPLLSDEPETTRFVFLTNRAFNRSLEKLRSQMTQRILEAEPLDDTLELQRLITALSKHAAKQKTDLDAGRCQQMLARTLFVKYFDEQRLRASVQLKLQALGRSDWDAAYSKLFDRFSHLSTRKGGSVVTLQSIEELLGDLSWTRSRHETFGPVASDLASVGTGLDRLRDLVREELRVKQKIASSKAVMERTRTQLTKLETYKRIHEALHTIEWECLRPIQESDTVPPLRRPRTVFAGEDRKIRQCLGSGVLGKAFARPIGDSVEEAGVAFESAVKSPDNETLAALLDALSHLASGHPPLLDARIAELAEELELHELIKVMKEVHTLVVQGPAAVKGLGPFVDGIEALGRLQKQLSARVAEHNRLQSLDNELRRACVGGSDAAAGSNEWRRIMKARARISPPFTPAFIDALAELGAIETEVQKALEHDPKKPLVDLIREYFRAVSWVFQEVDSGLRDLALELGRVRQPLETVIALV